MVNKYYHSAGDKTIELTLCAICARQFYDSKSHYIRRSKLWQAERETCMFCNTHPGFDFIITDTKLKPQRIILPQPLGIR